jgi:hypothetical protein
MFYAALTKDKQIIEAHSDNSFEIDNLKLDEIKQIAISRGLQESEFDLFIFTNEEWVDIIKLQLQE